MTVSGISSGGPACRLLTIARSAVAEKVLLGLFEQPLDLLLNVA